MQIPQIRVHSQPAQIEIQKTDAKLGISQPQAELSIKQPQAELTMHTIPGKLRIDQSEAWADLNLMHITKRNKVFASEGKNALMQGIARRAKQGDELMQIENNGNPLMSQAVQNSFEPMKSLGIKFIPSQFSVVTSYQPSELHIDVQSKKPVIKATPRSPEFTYEPGNVTTSLKQRQQLEISFINLYI
ncbi:DUF6470 family protein [Oceanobacillus sp. FSL K6-2867]|uniref:DUF6470 family protein n=1 Tax=Oceanobacillus sp. FSL K6-2867 TaxID=2954748 RepID=UPI0030DA1F3F